MNDKLSLVTVEYMREFLQIPAHMDADNMLLKNFMTIARNYISEETFRTPEQLDNYPLAVGVFQMLVASLYFNRESLGEVKENPVFRMMLNRISEVVV